MKALNVLAMAAVVAVGVITTSCNSKPSAKLSTAVDSVSYAIGVYNGSYFKKGLGSFPGGEVNVDAMIVGLTQALKGDSTKMTPQQAELFMNTYFREAQTKESKKNKEEGEKFLAENKTKAGVFTTESGLQYQVITEGNGPKPTEKDRVKVHYTGTLLDGTKFDSSVDRGEPAEFGVTQVIKGWTEGLQLMPVGSKYIFWIPSELAYGERQAGANIKPNSTLKFEVELLEIANK